MNDMSDYDIRVLEADKEKMDKIAMFSIAMLQSIHDDTDMRNVGLLFKANMNTIINID